MKAEKILQLTLFSLGLNAPVLLHFGYRLNRLLCLVVGEDESKATIDSFYEFNCLIIDESFSPTFVRKRISEETFSFILFSMNTEKKSTLEILSILYAAVASGYFNNRKFTATVIIVTENQYLRDVDNQLFFVCLTEPLQPGQIAISDVVPKPEELALVFHKIKELEKSEFDPASKIFYAAACFLFPHNQDNMILETCCSVLSSIFTVNEAFHNEGASLDQLFVKRITNWAKETNFSDVIELPYLNTDEYSRLNIAIFYSAEKDLMYISEYLFSKIIEKLDLSSPAIKRALADSGVLLPECSNFKTFTVKMNCFVNSKPHRPRMLRLNAEKLVSASGLMLIDACIMRKGKEKLNGQYQPPAASRT